MKGLLKYSLFAFLFAFLVTPLFAKTYSVTLAKAVTVGSTQIPAGDYKVSWEGAGPAVKVTLARSGASPVVVDAKLVTGKSFISDASVVTAAQNGSVVLQEIQVKSNTLVFEGSDVAAK